MSFDSDLKVFKLTGTEYDERSGYDSSYENVHFERTISAPSIKEVQMFILIHNLEEYNTYNFWHSYIDDEFTQVSSVCEDHISWTDLMKPPEPGFYHVINPESLEWAHRHLFGYSYGLPSIDEAREELICQTDLSLNGKIIMSLKQAPSPPDGGVFSL